MFKKLLFAFSLLLILSNLKSQVKINEYSVSNATLTTGVVFTDNTGGHPDWLELYNAGSSPMNIGGWTISDNPSNPGKYVIPAGTIINASGFVRFWCDGKGGPADVAGQIHTNFKLTQCQGDWIIVSNGGLIIDSLQLRMTQTSHSRGRTTDGAPTWKIFTTPTPNATNSGASYTEYAPTPVMNPPAGFYPGSKTVSITPLPTATLTTYYTTNGAEPTTGSTVYSSVTAIPISTTTVIRAIIVSSDPDVLPSFFETNTYLIGETINSQYGVVSISGGAPLNTLLGGTQNNPRTHLEYFHNGQFVTEGYGLSDKHGNDSWAYNQRGIDFETKDDYGYNNALKERFFTDTKLGYSKRKEFQHVILKAAASDNYPFNNGGQQRTCHMRDAFVQTYAFRKNLELDGRRCKHTLMFVNGQYWGLYELREAFETDYTDYYYDQPKDSIDNLAYWGSLQIRDGSDTGWVNLYNFVMANSMTNAANYAYVESKLNFKSLIDYMVYNSYVVNTDFINWNSAWWRGRAKLGDKKKWRYWMWDMDNVYDLGENFSGLPTTDMTSDPCDYTNVFQNAGPNEGHPDILDKLLDNQTFKSMYINRYADLLNSTFKCDSIMDHFNYFRSILTPEMPRQIAKWGGSMTQWNANLDTMKTRIQQRCSYIESKIASCYSVTPKPLTVTVDPPDAGNVKLNTIWLNTFPWSGTYFTGVTLNFYQTVLDTSKYEFDYWEFANHAPSPNDKSDSVSINFTTNESVIAHYIEKNSETTFPSAFTPNGDGRNDVLFPLSIRYIKSISVQVWNRWGQLVYSSTEASKGWDGNYQGTPAQTGVYAYLIKYTDIKGEEKISKGNVTLIR